jgi:hypothetical protein
MNFLRFSLFSIVLLLAISDALAQDSQRFSVTQVASTQSILSEHTVNCNVDILVPTVFLRGNGMVGGEDSENNGAAVGCTSMSELSSQFNIGYYLTDPNLGPEAATRVIDFLVYRRSLGETLRDRSVQYINRSEDGKLQVGKDMDFDHGTCPSIKRHDTFEVTGINWHGWIVESVFQKPASYRAAKYCPESTGKYRCINMAIGNDKMSAILHPRCFLRIRDNTLHTELGYEVFLDMMKTWRFKEQ